MTDSTAEQRVLKQSVGLTIAIATSGVVLGLVSGSMSIVFDGVFSMVDVAMLMLAMWVARLVTRDENRTFQYGYWHIEPMALAFNGGMLMLLTVYAFFSAVASLLSGGQEVELGWALGYSLAMAIAAFSMFAYERHANRAARSEFLHLDSQSWLMSALVAVALLVAFAAAWVLESTPYAHLAPYVDPATLAVLSLVLATMPIKTVRKAMREILLITPTNLDTQVRQVMDEVVSRHGFLGYTSYSAKVGRGRFVEIHIRVEPDQPIGTVAALDAIRDEIAEALGGVGPETWLTVDFTSKDEWT